MDFFHLTISVIQLQKHLLLQLPHYLVQWRISTTSIIAATDIVKTKSCPHCFPMQAFGSLASSFGWWAKETSLL